MPSIPEATAAVEVFYSYADPDERMRNELDKHLSMLKHQGLIAGWHHHNINAGMEQAVEIYAHLNTAHILLLLVSADFLASDYCYGVEMKRAMERHDTGEARVIPILLHPVDYIGAPFGKLAALPTNGKAVSLWRSRHRAFVDIAQGIRTVAEGMHTQSSVVLSLPSTSTLMSEKKTSPSAVLWNMPFPRNPFFTGREDLLRRIHTLLQTRTIAAVSQPYAISGLGALARRRLRSSMPIVTGRSISLCSGSRRIPMTR
jgi:hypothetical protein